jgi:hypothetical protein
VLFGSGLILKKGYPLPFLLTIAFLVMWTDASAVEGFRCENSYRENVNSETEIFDQCFLSSEVDFFFWKQSNVRDVMVSRTTGFTFSDSSLQLKCMNSEMKATGPKFENKSCFGEEFLPLTNSIEIRSKRDPYRIHLFDLSVIGLSEWMKIQGEVQHVMSMPSLSQDSLPDELDCFVGGNSSSLWFGISERSLEQLPNCFFRFARVYETYFQ